MSALALIGQLSLGVCLQLASATETTPAFVPVQSFTLSWEHSIEKVRWEEDYEVLLKEQRPLLLATAARIRGSAAGMEPPDDAIFTEGWYQYRPLIPEHHELRLTRSEFVPDYEWCDSSGCRSLSDILPSDGNVTLMWACEKDS
ncbi:MAG TPA: DUF1850 domain-containing protein [Oligella sp.]|nr:DUF1850 domain-containing protein [Oligella sp.]